MFILQNIQIWLTSEVDIKLLIDGGSNDMIETLA